MSTPVERLDEGVRAAGREAAGRAMAAESTLMEQVRYVIDHEAETGDEAGTEVFACDYVIYAIFDLFRKAMLSDEAVSAAEDGIQGTVDLLESQGLLAAEGWSQEARAAIIHALASITGEPS